MWLTAANLVFLAGGVAVYLAARRWLLRAEGGGRRRKELAASLVVGLLAVLGFATAHLGMNVSWTGRAIITDFRWLAFALAFGGLLLLVHASLRALRSRSDQLMLPVAAFLVLLGLINIYVWEARDANAYISTVALPVLRDQNAALANDPSLSPTRREEIKAALGPVPNELGYEAGGGRHATVLDSGWLDSYNAAARRFRVAGSQFPTELALAANVREVAPDEMLRRQLMASAIGFAMLPLVLLVVVRARGDLLWGSSLSLVLTSGLALVLVGVAVLGTAGDRLPPLLRLGGTSLTIYELLKLVLVVAVAISLGQIRSRRDGSIRAKLGLFVAALAIAGMLWRDPGAGTVLLAIVALMGSLVIGRRARLAGAVAGVALLALMPAGVGLLDSHLPQTVRVRIATWVDPWGSNHRAELQNVVAGSLDGLADIAETLLRDDGGDATVVLALERVEASSDRSAVRDASLIEQEFRWRLAGMQSLSNTGQPFVPAADTGEERVLLEAEHLWADLGGFAVDPSDERAMSRFRARVTESLTRLRTGAGKLDGARRGQVPLTSDAYPSAKAPDNFQLQRSLFALEHGGALGVGLGQGRPEAIPDVTEDVPLAALGESLGFGVVALFGLFVLLLAARGMQASRNVRERAPALLAAGLSAMLGVQVLISVGGMSGALPFTGLTLPLVSRSGTGLVANLVALALIVAILERTARDDDGRTGSDRRARETLRTWGFPAAFALVLSSMAVLQLTGRTLTPGPILAKLPNSSSAFLHASDQWNAASYRAVLGPIVDRRGETLAQTTALAATRAYPDLELSTTLGHTLRQLDLSFRDELLTSVRGGDKASRPPELVTTSDAGVQRAVDAAIDRGASEGGLSDLDSLRGAAVVLDATTGDIVALESRPTFSLAEIVDPELWTQKEAVERRAGFSYRYLNRAIQGFYPPGSVAKTVTAAGALELGLHPLHSPDFDYRSGETGLRSPDGLEQLGSWHRLSLADGPPIYDGNHPHVADWLFDIEEAFAYSCNVAFAEMGLELGPERLADFARRFGFEQPITVEGLGTSTGTLDTDGGLPLGDRFFSQTSSALARTAFGQGEMLATPLQIALIPAAIANGGTIMQPRIVAGIRDTDGSWIWRDEPTVLLETGLSERTISDLRQLMTAAVSYGLADTAAVSEQNIDPGVAGKTGSAEWTDDGATHAWFVGYFPVESPRLALAIVIERGGSGREVAARIAGHIFGSPEVAAFLRTSE